MTSSAAHSRAWCRRPPAARPRRPGTARHQRGLPAGVPGTGRQDSQLRHPAPAATPGDEHADGEYAGYDAEDREQPSSPADIPGDEPEQDVPGQRREVPAATTTGNGRYSSVSVPPVSGRDGPGRIWRVTPPGTRSRARAVSMARSASLPSWPESNRPRYRTAPCANDLGPAPITHCASPAHRCADRSPTRRASKDLSPCSWERADHPVLYFQLHDTSDPGVVASPVLRSTRHLLLAGRYLRDGAGRIAVAGGALDDSQRVSR
jgi:hypothetical protein